MRSAAQLKVKSDLDNPFQDEKYRQHQGERDHSEDRIYEKIYRGCDVEHSEQELPEDAANAAGVKGKDEVRYPSK